MSDNKLKELPEGFGAGMKALVNVDISQNCIGELPADIGAAGSIRTLQASKNEIKELPDSFDLAQLSVLDLSSNALTKLDRAIGQIDRARDAKCICEQNQKSAKRAQEAAGDARAKRIIESDF